MLWKRNGKIIKDDLIVYLKKILEKEINNGYKLKVCIGTDSQKHGKKYKFATVIVIETKEVLSNQTKKMVIGRGGIVIGTTYMDNVKNIGGLNNRMLKEVEMSIKIGYEIWPLLELYDIPLEIHADINPDPKFASNVAMSETLGYIKGMGWIPKIKPNAYAASTNADKFC